MELSTSQNEQNGSQNGSQPEAFPHLYYIKKPILANRLFSLFAELLRLVEKYGNISEPWVVSHWSDKVN